MSPHLDGLGHIESGEGIQRGVVDQDKWRVSQVCLDNAELAQAQHCR
jgi:hypothetical protein